jgi:beta-1,4-mannosyl-glycoprotein beta-1,4-N-acetylglucosaminyltransferase
MKVFDMFTFFNELDLLKFRMELLDDVVDYHVIVESNLTHSGKEKFFTLGENLEQFKKWKHKIIMIQVDQKVEGLSFDDVKSYTPSNGSWILENEQRNALMYASNMVSDEDIVLVGDLDEIPFPETVKILKEYIPIISPISIKMLFHYYYMNCQNIGYERYWNGTVACQGKTFKETTPQDLRNSRNSNKQISGGYHFSFLGGVEKIRTKIQSFAHTEFNNPEITSDEHIIKSLERGEDIFNRPGVRYKFVGLEEYPETVRNLMLKYPHFIKL